MLLLLLCLIVSVVSHWEPCPCSMYQELIPGADVLAGGFDVTQLSTIDDRSFKSPIFSYHNPTTRCLQSTLGGKCYLVPFELTPYDLDVTFLESVNGIYSSSNEYLNTYSESYDSSFGIKTPYIGSSYDYHKSLYDSNYYFSKSYVNQGFGYYVEYLYTMTMPPAYVLTLDYIFKLSLDMLPSNITNDSDNKKYNEFLSSYGGYYLNSIILGGKFHLNQYTDEYITTQYSQGWESEQMGITFKSTMFEMETGHSSNSSEYQNSQDYVAHSNSLLYCFGGNVNLACASNEWMLSIVNYPGYLNITYTPLYTLIYNDQDKSDNLKMKTDFYSKYGYYQ